MVKIVRTTPLRQHQPKEAPSVVPQETLIDDASEIPSIKPIEGPQIKVCGVNGCTTWYDDPVVMKRHYQRVHGVNDHPNLNQPAPRNSEIKLA